MTSDAFTVGPDESIATLQDLISKKHIRHVPVVDDGGAVLGLISERDVLQRTFFEEADRVTDIMAWDVETIDADEDLSRAAQIMRDNKHGCLPVVEKGVLAGILTEADFVKFGAPSRGERIAKYNRLWQIEREELK